MQNRSKFPQILPQILPQRFWHPILISFENKQTQSKTKSKLWKQHICLFPIFFKRVSPIKDPSKTPEQKKTNKQNLYVYNFPSHTENTKKNYVCCIYRWFSCLTTYICFHDIQGFLHDVSYDFTLFFHDFQCFANFLLHFFHNSSTSMDVPLFFLKKSWFSMVYPVDFWIFHGFSQILGACDLAAATCVTLRPRMLRQVSSSEGEARWMRSKSPGCPW